MCRLVFMLKGYLLMPHLQDIIARDPATHGSMFVPMIFGTDKTTVSVATGQQVYHPVYLSVGNVHNRIRRAHKDSLVLIGFLPIPKGTRQDMKSNTFRDFRNRLFHGCLTAINDTVKPYMKKWDVVRCPDLHFRRAIYGLGPHIQDYPEQSATSGIVYGWCMTYAICLTSMIYPRLLTFLIVVMPTLRISMAHPQNFVPGHEC